MYRWLHMTPFFSLKGSWSFLNFYVHCLCLQSFQSRYVFITKCPPPMGPGDSPITGTGRRLWAVIGVMASNGGKRSPRWRFPVQGEVTFGRGNGSRSRPVSTWRPQTKMSDRERVGREVGSDSRGQILPGLKERDLITKTAPWKR